MGQFLNTYHDRTHNYRLQDNAIIMTPRGAGPECQMTYASPAEARSALRWLIDKAQLRKGVQSRAN